MEGKWDSLSLLYDDGDQIAYSEEDPYGQAIDDFDAYGEADGFPPIHNLDLSGRRISIDDGDYEEPGDAGTAPPPSTASARPPARPPKVAPAPPRPPRNAPAAANAHDEDEGEYSDVDDPYHDLPSSMAGAGFATQPDYGDCAITGTELAANADYGQNYDDPLPGDDDDVDYEPVAEDYDRVDDDAYEDPPQNRRSSAQNIHRAAGAATIPAEGLYGEIEDDGSAPLPPPKQPPRRLTGQDAARHAKAKARVAEGMKRSEADGMDNEESFYGAAGDEPGRFATASQLPKRTEGSRHSLAYKMYGEVVFCDLSRKDTEAKLAEVAKGKDGVYLLRTSANLFGGVVVSFYCGGATRHFQFKRDGDCFINKAGKKVGRTVVELIRYYRHNWQDGLPCAPSVLYLPAPMKR
eukprot:m.134572 g.134572  ORF g.134572 m.134572 type:complete len:407 (-) comp22534_c0_seq1:151-1371(-)